MVNLLVSFREKDDIVSVFLPSIEELMRYAAELEDDSAVKSFSIENVYSLTFHNGLTADVLPYYWRKYV